jgi:hypothetical protein
MPGSVAGGGFSDEESRKKEFGPTRSKPVKKGFFRVAKEALSQLSYTPVVMIIAIQFDALPET